MLTLQQIVRRLTDFWEKRGCIVHFGHDLETGAGTFNPATFLRCLGPEPYNTVYVEPSRRPSDGRYGSNPNRIQLFHQLQVIMKPSPPDIVQMYLDSLRALDFDLKKHDIRFVHDDWESPSLGAWGLGWEIWCDGMEVSQFTYFQSMASLPLKPVSAEITVGLERLAMFVQNKDDIFDIQWNETLTLRDVSHQNEVEWSLYNFQEANTTMWLKHFEDYEKEAKTLVTRHLPLPAYDFVVKASHAFNMLDARGVISVTERTRYITRVRELARLCAAEYTASRENLGHPLLLLRKEKPKKIPALKKPPKFNPENEQDFLLEIGSEPLPATFVPIAISQLEKAIRTLLQAHNLTFQSIQMFGTPQRTAVLIKGLKEGSHPRETLRRGPPTSSAFDLDGKPTPQAEGFFRSIGLPPPLLAEIQKGKVKGVSIAKVKEADYLFACIAEPGTSTFHLLSEQLPDLILGLDFPKKMHWGDLDISYARPLRWIAALFGKKVIPFQVGQITSDRLSRGHAQLAPKSFSIPLPKNYPTALKKHFVMGECAREKRVDPQTTPRD